MNRAQISGYESIRIEGGILPAEFLNSVSSLAASNQTAADYRLPKGLILRDEIGRYWRIAHCYWQDYQARRTRHDLDPNRVGVEEWLLPLFSQVLGLMDLQQSSPRVLDDRIFPITHFASKKNVPILVSTHAFDLDKSHSAFGQEGHRRTPHGLVQEYLNAEPRCLWGLAANGLTLRLLRKNPSLTRPAYVEVDLERLFKEVLFPDFAVFWLIFHASRFESDDGNPQHSIIESWRDQAPQTGERALQKLRAGVTGALRTLGTGFVEHSANCALRSAIQCARLSPESYFQQLLRLVYR